MQNLHIPTVDIAERLLCEGEALNPGLWAAHSRSAAQAARILAGHLPGLDSDSAYVLGLLHDIGRSAGVSDMRHIIDGYRLLNSLGYENGARVCLTHSFPLQDIHTMDGNWDGTDEDWQFIAEYLDQVEYTAYDRLIQLCDAVALPHGFCLIEKRIVDVAIRRGVNELTIAKWKSFFAIQIDFEQQLGESIYKLLPGVIENTFGMR